MSENKRRCMRCRGLKKVFRIGAAYSLVDTGGTHITCPLCNGEGVIDKIKDVSTIMNETPQLETKDVASSDLESKTKRRGRPKKHEIEESKL